MVDPNELETAEQTKKIVQETIETLKRKAPPKVAETLGNALKRVQEENISLQEALGLSDEAVEKFYEHGYLFFQSGKFKEAIAVFKSVLRLSGGANQRCLLAIAACLHHMKIYPDAAAYYILYEALNPKDPIPYFHLYDCFKHLNSPGLALNSLKKASELAAEDPFYSDFKFKLDKELDYFRSTLKESEEKKEEKNAE